MNGVEGVETVATASERSLVVEPSESFVLTRPIEAIVKRALVYLKMGYAIHFAGPAGTGKTTLAFHCAAELGRPVTLLHGDDEFGSSDLVGRDAGYRKTKLIDNFIRTVLKTDEEMQTTWVDNRLTTACKTGDTLIYDEFTRSRPEANNVLLMVLAEKILNLPRLRVAGEGYLEVHPDFRAIFTSNPEEYAGVHKLQDALLDRMVTIRLGHYDRETEVRIVAAKSGTSHQDAEAIVDVVRSLRELAPQSHRPSVRASITIGRVLSHEKAHARPTDPVFRWVLRDVLATDTGRVTRDGQSTMAEKIEEVLGRSKGDGNASKRNGKPSRDGKPSIGG